MMVVVVMMMMMMMIIMMGYHHDDDRDVHVGDYDNDDDDDDSLTSGRFLSNSKNVIFKFAHLTNRYQEYFLGIALTWMPQNPLMVSQHWFR